MDLAQELLVNVQCSGSSRSFEKETRAVKIRSTLPGHLVDSDQLRGLSKYLTATQEVSQELCQPFYGCLAFEANWKDEKA